MVPNPRRRGVLWVLKRFWLIGKKPSVTFLYGVRVREFLGKQYVRKGEESMCLGDDCLCD